MNGMWDDLLLFGPICCCLIRSVCGIRKKMCKSNGLCDLWLFIVFNKSEMKFYFGFCKKDRDSR